MSRRSRFILPLALGLIFGLAPGVQAQTASADQQPINAKILMKSKSTIDAKVYGRLGDWVRMETPKSNGVNRYLASEIAGISFDFGDLEEKAQELYWTGKYVESAKVLHSVLAPLHRLLDIRNNAGSLLKLELKSMYWAGAQKQTLELCDVILESSGDDTLKQQAMIYKALTLMDLKQYKEAAPLIKLIKPADKDSELSTPYLYVTTQLQMSLKQWDKALATIGELISFHHRDDEWMPIALYTSARIHQKFRHKKIVHNIIREINLAYPRSRWAAKAITLPEDYPIPDFKNPNFEANSFTSEPGFIGAGGNGDIAHWSASPPNKAGLNSRHLNKFADNAILPEGENVAIVQVGSKDNDKVDLYQDISGFSQGDTYFLIFNCNSSAKTKADENGPFLTVKIDEKPIVKSFLVKPVQKDGRHTSPYHSITSMPFVATAKDLKLTFQTMGYTAPEGRTLLLDQIQLLDWDIDRGEMQYKYKLPEDEDDEELDEGEAAEEETNDE